MRYHARTPHRSNPHEALLYKLFRPLLFLLDAETSHRLSFSLLRCFYSWPGLARLLGLRRRHRTPHLPVTVMGVAFPNPLGLAAGLDKNAEYIKPLAGFGFGFLELGTVTPRPQPGNPAPRMFRLVNQAAIINRLGFNNVGMEKFVANLASQEEYVPLGINIGKNRDTPIEQAADDYLRALRAVYIHADYISVNISSPNTSGLRELQKQENLDDLLRLLKSEQLALAEKYHRYVPIALKIAPDLDDAQISVIAQLVLQHKFDAVIATNTTIARHGLGSDALAAQTGGLSGRPLKSRSTEVIRKLYAQLQAHVPIIGVGGVENADDAWEKFVAGADLIQIYTALIYQGPGIVNEIVQGLAQRLQSSGCVSLSEAIVQARK
ncbi:MAG: quinone-dependent dihydroorotate dehydrogenase [Gammaproteobacteria bacterium]|nr:quinone-dependent dihydroorotate dehydrogenase [Gammaproteobacteria bacterium]